MSVNWGSMDDDGKQLPLATLFACGLISGFCWFGAVVGLAWLLQMCGVKW